MYHPFNHHPFEFKWMDAFKHHPFEFKCRQTAEEAVNVIEMHAHSHMSRVTCMHTT